MQIEVSLTEISVERFTYPASDSASFACSYLKDEHWQTVISRGYQGFWSNEKTLEVCTYCEGDIVVKKLPTEAAFEREYLELSSWYAKNN